MPGTLVRIQGKDQGILLVHQNGILQSKRGSLRTAVLLKVLDLGIFHHFAAVRGPDLIDKVFYFMVVWQNADSHLLVCSHRSQAVSHEIHLHFLCVTVHTVHLLAFVHHGKHGKGRLLHVHLVLCCLLIHKTGESDNTQDKYEQQDSQLCQYFFHLSFPSKNNSDARVGSA